MRPRLFTAIAMLAGVALGAGSLLLYGQWAGRSADTDPGTAGERLAKLPSFGKSRATPGQGWVAALARLQPSGEAIDLGGLPGDRLGTLLVEEGTEVKKGDILGYLESYGERQADLAAVTAQLAEAEMRLKAETAYANSQIQEAHLAIRSAREIDPLEVQARAAKARLLETELAAAQKDLERMRAVESPALIPAQQIDQQTQLVRRFTQELTAARALLASAQTAAALQLQQARARLAGAEAGLERVKAVAQIDSLRKAQLQAQARLDRTVLRAPRDGRILTIHCRPGERVDPRPILQMGDTRVMYAVAEVYETDVGLVKPGQRTRVRSPALPAELTGTTEKMGWSVGKNEALHTDPAASADARVLKVWIRLDPAEGIDRLSSLQVDVLIDAGDSSTPPPVSGPTVHQRGEKTDG